MAFFNGPLNKSIYTQELELFTKCMLAHPEVIKFDYQQEAGNKQLYGYVEDVPVNLSKLLQKANFTHINLSEQDSNFYVAKMLGENRYSINADIKKQHEFFTQAEKLAIVDYTGPAYMAINKLMYTNGKNYQMIDQSSVPITNNYLASDLLKVMFISSGLNKIMPETGSIGVKTYRGEHSTTEAQLQDRINSIKAEDSYIQTPAYMSTSSSKDVAGYFSNKVIIEFDDVYGKSIENMSNAPAEHEYLLPPVKIQWISHEETKITQDDSEKIVHKFTARVVNPLVPGENDPDFNDIAEFETLHDWAVNNQIDNGFITEYNKNLLIAECLDNEQDIDIGYLLGNLVNDAVIFLAENIIEVIENIEIETNELEFTRDLLCIQPFLAEPFHELILV